MKQELLKNTLVVGVGRIFAQFTGLLLVPVYTSYLSPGEYGLGDLIITYAALALPFITLSLEQGAFRFLVDARRDQLQKTIITSFLARIVLTLGSLLIAVAVFLGYLLSFELTYWACFFVASSVIMNVGLWYARGVGKSYNYAVANVVTGVLTLVFGVLFVAVFSMGVVGMLGALSLANLASGLYSYLSLSVYKHINFKIRDKKLEKELLAYSLPLVPNSISWWLINAADRTVITLTLGVVATGMYGVAVKFPAILVGVFGVFWISWHESASVYINHKDRDKFFSKVTNTTIVLFGCLGLAILAALSVVFDYVVGVEFREAYLYIPILMTGALGHSLVTLYGSIYAAKKQTRQILNTTVLAGAINIAVMLVAIPLIGLFGAAVASVVAYFSMVVYRHADVRKYVRISIDVHKIIPLLALTFLVVSFYYINNDILNFASLAIVILAGIYLNKTIFISMKDMIWKKSQKS